MRISGRVHKVDPAESQRYFDSRPMDSRVAAAISAQSSPIEDRVQLERKFDALMAKAEGGQVAMPEDWGGYRLEPTVFEFWQGRVGRLHDRFRYRKDGEDLGRGSSAALSSARPTSWTKRGDLIADQGKTKSLAAAVRHGLYRGYVNGVFDHQLAGKITAGGALTVTGRVRI